jgi:3-oxoadipate enol-lactonase
MGSMYFEIERAPGLAQTPWVILIHGLGSCGEDWLLQRMALRGRYHLLIPDLPGLGRSSSLRGRPTVAGVAQALARMGKRLIPSSDVNLIGLSLGAAVALQMALDAPQRVCSLVLVNGFACGRQATQGVAPGLGRLLGALTGGMPHLAERIALGLFPRLDQEAYRTVASRRIGSTPPGNYLKLLAAIYRFDVRPRLASLATPTLVVAGGSDNTVPLASAQHLARSLPDARLEVVAGAGHALPVDSAEAFHGLLLPFLERHCG